MLIRAIRLLVRTKGARYTWTESLVRAAASRGNELRVLRLLSDRERSRAGRDRTPELSASIRWLPMQYPG